jgi:hypothetical protein
MEFFLEQIVALLVFFAFPAFQYWFLKHTAKKEGNPELWFLPKYGFRLVIRNLPRKRNLSNIRYRVTVRTIVPASSGSSVKTYQDTTLVEKDDFFLFPSTDHVLISFQLKNNSVLKLVHTDKLGNENAAVELSDSSVLIADYTATINNWFNFDIHLAKRVEVNYLQLQSAFDCINKNNSEQLCNISRVRNVD